MWWPIPAGRHINIVPAVAERPARITKKSSQPRLPGVLKRVNNLRETANQAIIWNVIEVPHIVEAWFMTERFSDVGFDITLRAGGEGSPRAEYKNDESNYKQ